MRNKSKIYKAKRIVIAAFFFSVFIVLFLSVAKAWALEENSSKDLLFVSVCRTNGLYLKVGELRMYFPYEYIGKLGGIRTYNPETNTKCYEPGDEPLDTVSTKFSPRAYFADYYSENDKPLVEKGSSPFMAVLLAVRRLPFPSGAYEAEHYETFDETSAVLLPEENGFKVYIRERLLEYINKTIPEKVYVSKELRTYKNNPVTFICTRQYSMFKKCETRIAIGNVLFEMTNIDTGHIPVSEWPNFYKQMRVFLDNSIVRDDAHLKLVTDKYLKQP